MKIFVTAKPGSRKENIRKIDETHFTVAVKEPPVKGMANRAIVKVLAEYLKKPPFRLAIISGATSKHKIIEVYE